LVVVAVDLSPFLLQMFCMKIPVDQRKEIRMRNTMQSVLNWTIITLKIISRLLSVLEEIILQPSAITWIDMSFNSLQEIDPVCEM